MQPTKPKPPKKKLSKQEKEDLRIAILKQMALVKGKVKNATFKKDIRSGGIELRRLERKLKKLN